MQIQNARIALGGERLATQVARSEEALRATRSDANGSTDIGLYRRTESASLEYASYGELARPRQSFPPPLRAPELVPLRLRAPTLPGVPTPVAPAPTATRTPAPAPTPADSALANGDGDLLLLALLIEVLSGREVEVARVAVGAPATASVASPVATPAPAGPSGPAAQFSIDYSFSAYYRETEQTTLRATGTVVLADGRQVDFDLQVAMQRSFESSVDFAFHAGQRKDPLALALDGSAVQLDTVRYAFDIDADGQNEQIAFTTTASAFLAIDLDSDGRVTDGRELFGALSGDGFADLAQSDSDGNGFIDGNDPLFGRLRAWRKNADGSDRLESLATLGIGALYLGSVATPFELRGPGNEALGAVSRSGLFLREDGGTGALQQLDLVV